MRNAPSVRGEIGRINSPNLQLAGSMNFSTTNGVSSRGSARKRISRDGAQSVLERDNIIKVMTLMEALLERVYYPSAIIAGNALYGANCSAISAWNFRPIIPASIKVSQWKSHGCNPVRIFEITPPRFVVTRCDR